MIKNTINDDELNSIFLKDIKDEFDFSFDIYLSFLEDLSLNPLLFFNTWSDLNRKTIVEKYWKPNTKLDWKWSLSFPFFSLLEKYIESMNYPIIIGFSGLPGSGKSTLGSWINNVARELCLDIKVISLDDFYLPGKQMDIALDGNPWNVSRGFPGSHSIDLLNKSLDTFLNTGYLKCPIFDKSLRDGKGDRSGWCEFRTKVLILEGWFVGCEPISNHMDLEYTSEQKYNLSLSPAEEQYRILIQESLIEYSQIWKMFEKIWHLKSPQFNNTVLWKRQQEEEMIKLKGAGLKDNRLKDFVRMIQASIPQESLLSINSDTTIEINHDRSIINLYTNKYDF